MKNYKSNWFRDRNKRIFHDWSRGIHFCTLSVMHRITERRIYQIINEELKENTK